LGPPLSMLSLFVIVFQVATGKHEERVSKLVQILTFHSRKIISGFKVTHGEHTSKWGGLGEPVPMVVPLHF
jgi:hypothetical protein